jgi:hypothetical protein
MKRPMLHNPQKSMSAIEFDDALRRLGWNRRKASEQLGKSRRHIQRFAAGDSEVPRAIARLLRILLDDERQ